MRTMACCPLRQDVSGPQWRNVKNRIVLFVGLLTLIVCSESAAFAQADGQSFVEGHVFDARTLRPLQRASVTLVGFLGSSLAAFSPAETDSGGLYQRIGFSTPALDAYDQIDLVVQCKLGKSGKRVTYSTPFYNPLVVGRIYTRDVYLKIPDGETGCRAGSFSPPAAPTGR